MKTKYRLLFSFAALITAAIFALAGCSSDSSGGGGGGPQTVTYTGTSDEGTFTLKITESAAAALLAYTPKAGDTYELTAAGKKSSGKVNSFESGTFTLKPSNSEETFTAAVSRNSLSSVTGTITWEDGSTNTGPGALTPGSGGYNPNYPIYSDLWTLAENHDKTQAAAVTFISVGTTFGAFATWLGISFDDLIAEFKTAIGSAMGETVVDMKQTDQSPTTSSIPLTLTTAVYIAYE